MKYHHFYLRLLFGELSHRSDPSANFLPWWFKRCRLTQKCVFRFCWCCNFGVKSSINPNFGTLLDVFKQNMPNTETFILSKPNFAQWWISSSSLHTWFNSPPNIHDGRRPPSWKIEKSRLFAMDWPIFMKFGGIMQLGSLDLNSQ